MQFFNCELLIDYPLPCPPSFCEFNFRIEKTGLFAFSERE